MKYIAEVVVKLYIEAKDDEIATETIKSNKLFLKVSGAGVSSGVYSIKTNKDDEQKILFLKQIK